MHHFTSSTCFQLADSTKEAGLWQITIPKMAFHHPFLLHGLLALAALHLGSDQSDGRQADLLELAHNLQEQALSTYIPLLDSLSTYELSADVRVFEDHRDYQLRSA